MVVARRGVTESGVAGGIGSSFAYNVTKTVGASAVVRPMLLVDTLSIHVAWAVMQVALTVAVWLARR